MRRFPVVFLIIAAAACIAAAQPTINVTIEPLEQGSVVYSPIAARSANHQTTGQIALLLRIHNPTLTPLILEKVEILYEGPGAGITEKEIEVDGLLPMDLPAGRVVYWHQVRDDNHDTVIYLTENFEPNLIIVKLYCKGIAKPLTISKAMKKHSSPFVGGSYLFPGKAKDMRPGEYWYTRSRHDTSSYGSQLFAYDMYALGWDEEKKDYSSLLPGTDGCKNTDHRAYDKPVYAMAEGVVVRFKDGVADNPMPYRLTGDTDTDCPTQAEKAAFDCTGMAKGTGGGNYIMIRSRGEVHGYAHLKAGTLNERLIREPEQRVNAGVYLGRIGNTGCSSFPHTHFDLLRIHDLATLKTTSNENHPDIVSLRPLLFHDIFTIDADLLTGRDPEPEKWSKVIDRAIPKQFSLIWGSKNEPCYHVPEIPEISYHGISFDDFQTLFDRADKCGYYPEWVDGFEFKGRSYYNMVFRYDPGRAWRSRHKQDLQEFNAYRQELEAAGYRLIFVDSYPGGDKTWFSSIYVRDNGAQTRVTPMLPDVGHDAMFNQLTGNGWRPIRVSSVFAGGMRFTTTLYEKKAVGKWEMRVRLTGPEYEALLEKNADKGLELVHLNAYITGEGERFGAIWHQNTPFTTVSGRHGLSGLDYRLKLDDHLKTGYLTRSITGYEVNDSMIFAAAWAK